MMVHNDAIGRRTEAKIFTVFCPALHAAITDKHNAYGSWVLIVVEICRSLCY